MTLRPFHSAIAVAVVYWLIEGLAESYLLGDVSLASALAGVESTHELWMRLTVVGLILATGLIADRALARVRALHATSERLNRLLRFLSEVNQRVQRIRDTDDLTDAACHAAVAVGGFGMAWVGERDERGAGVVARSQACRDAGLSAALEAAGGIGGACSVAGRAIDTDARVHCRPATDGDCPSPWRSHLVERDLGEAYAFPIREEDRSIAALVIHADEGEVFSAEELAVLEEVADDISVAVTAIAHARERERSRRTLEQRVEELERFRAATVDRELRTEEMSEELSRLRARAGKEPGG